MFIPKEITELALLFGKNNKKLYIVGGAVRDSILSKEPKDYDLATDATPNEVKNIVGDVYDNMYTGKSYGISRIFPKGFKEGIEVATFRKDSISSDSRRPDSVEFTDLITDLSRRDLTINACAMDIITKEIIDPFGGEQDLKNKIVRTVGDPYKRFEEDSLRKIRAIRFTATLDFDLDITTSDAIKEEPFLYGVSKERIRDEFIKGINKCKSVDTFLGLLDSHNLLDQMFFGDIKSVIPDSPLMKNIPFLLAYIYDTDETIGMSDDLFSNTYTYDEIFNSCLLKDIYIFALDKNRWKTDDILKIKKREIKSGLSKENITSFLNLYDSIDKHFISSYEEYSPLFKENGLMEQGFSGKALGDKINSRELEKWLEIISI